MQTLRDGSNNPISYDIKYNVADVAGNLIAGDIDLDRIDNPKDTTGNDRIYLIGGNDLFTGLKGGNDCVSGDDGRDSITGGTGNDLIEGGTDGVASGNIGGDILNGGIGNDALYGDMKLTLAEAIRTGESDPASLDKGDYLRGGEGDDLVVGGNTIWREDVSLQRAGDGTLNVRYGVGDEAPTVEDRIAICGARNYINKNKCLRAACAGRHSGRRFKRIAGMNRHRHLAVQSSGRLYLKVYLLLPGNEEECPMSYAGEAKTPKREKRMRKEKLTSVLCIARDE